jgi:hypothetical protein
MTNVKDKRFCPAQRGSRGRVFCFDCGRATGAVQLVRRYPYDDDPTRDLVAWVCRKGTGCHRDSDPR